MSVKARLDRLRSESTHQSPAAHLLAERIGRLRVAQRSNSVGAGMEATGRHGLLPGVAIAAGVRLVERRIAFGTQHGRYRLARIESSAQQGLPETADLDQQRLLFLDTETTGLNGGSGTLAFLVGMARLQRGELIMRQYLLNRFDGESAMLTALAAEVRQDDTLVTYNGKSFDLPLLATRFRMIGAVDPLPSLAHLDLLHPVRRLFAQHWVDCRLARAEQQLLGFFRHQDLPGAQVPAAWTDWIRDGDAGRLTQVCRHNGWDLLSLALLLPRLAEIHRHPAAHGADPLAAARGYRKAGRDTSALTLLIEQRASLGVRGLTELAALLKRRGEVHTACAIWHDLCLRGDQTAHEQLAKHYEHTVGDYQRALAYAEALQEGDRKAHRCARLQRKLAHSEQQSQIAYG